MGRQICRRLILAAAVALTALPLSAQKDTEQKDSLVRLMKGSSIELIEKYGVKYRKAIDATFLHNNTYLICDTALWNVDSKLINCWGNVKLMQEETELTSDKLDYFVENWYLLKLKNCKPEEREQSLGILSEILALYGKTLADYGVK